MFTSPFRTLLQQSLFSYGLGPGAVFRTSLRYQRIKTLRSGGAAGGSSLPDRARKSVRSKPNQEDPSQEPKDRKLLLLAALFFPCPNSASASEGLGSLTESSSHNSGTARPKGRLCILENISQQLPLNGTAAFRSKRSTTLASSVFPEVACELAS
jgi:hypothetical protein